MSSLHGFYSVGTVVGAGIGWLVSRLGLSLPQHMLIQTPFLWAIVLVATFHLLPTKETHQQTKSGSRPQANHHRLGVGDDGGDYGGVGGV
ncbi:MAG UNVERIFIED_CONTAM: hypothetical protein LVT10_20685 [Anaerolineae bacterium]|jgi:F0F1-type ATP synthase assembly protein I